MAGAAAGSESQVYLFQGNYLLVPEEMSDRDAPRGVGNALAGAAFGGRVYCAIPPVEGRAPVVSGCLVGDGEPLPAGWRPFSVRQAAASLAGAGNLPGGEAGSAAALLRAYHIVQWREDSRFCGSCGSANGDSPDELARLCPACGRLEYPRISPAVIVLVTNGRGEALLAHNRKFKENVYSLVAGFTEAGESLEAAVKREVREEVNVGVTDVRYAASQSWPFPNSLMVGFTARYADGELKPDGAEIADARWFGAESVRNGFPELPARGSVSRYMIDRWLDASGQ